MYIGGCDLMGNSDCRRIHGDNDGIATNSINGCNHQFENQEEIVKWFCAGATVVACGFDIYNNSNLVITDQKWIVRCMGHEKRLRRNSSSLWINEYSGDDQVHTFAVARRIIMLTY